MEIPIFGDKTDPSKCLFCKLRHHLNWKSIIVLTLLAVVALCLFLIYSQDVNGEQDPSMTKYYIIQKDETLYEIAEHFDLGLNEVLQANSVITNPDFIYAGSTIILPIEHLIPNIKPGEIVVNLVEERLYFFSDKGIVSFPISIGKDEKTPIGITKIISKHKDPYWIPPISIRQENPNLPEIVAPGPKNPLGSYAIYVDSYHDSKWQNIVIHGTNEPWTIGSEVSHGCIRLYPQDIKKLFNQATIGAPVIVINQPIKVSQINNKIYLELHLKEMPELSRELSPDNTDVKELICQKIKDCQQKVNWQKVDDAVIENLGIPIDISGYSYVAN